MPQTFRPLFRLDPGWPFVLAGLAILVATILIPAQRELHDLRIEARKAELYEARTYARLMAYDGFLADLRGGDAQLVRRLAVAQLNLVPKGEEPIVLTAGMDHSVAQWIDESVPSVEESLRPRDTDPYPDTLLARLALGPNRLWMIAVAAMLVFVGLLLGSEESRAAAIDPCEPLDRPAPSGDGSPREAAGSRLALASALETESREDSISESIETRLDASALDAIQDDLGDDDDIIDVEIVEARQAEEFDDAPLALDEVDGCLGATAIGDEEIVSGEPEWPHASADSGRIESVAEFQVDRDSRSGGELERAFRDRVVEPDIDRIAPARYGAD